MDRHEVPKSKIMRLPNVVTRNGSPYALIKRSDEAMIYKNKNGYEIFKNKIVRLKGNSEFSYQEVFPKNEETGIRTWFTTSAEKAEQIFKRIDVHMKKI